MVEAVEGKATEGKTATGEVAPVLIGGVDSSGNAESVGTDGSGGIKVAVSSTAGDTTVVGKAADGAAKAGNPVLVAGEDGTNAQTLLTDSDGHLQVDALSCVSTGAAADGAAVSGNPVLVAGQDGTNAQSLKTDSTGRLEVGGGQANGAALAGNPMVIAGKNASNQAEIVHIGTGGELAINVQNTGSDSFANTFLGQIQSANGNNGMITQVAPSVYNGDTWDRTRNNVDATLLSSTARTASVNSSDITNYNGRGVVVVINVTSITDTPSVVFTIQGKDSVSSVYYDILASAAVTATGTTTLTVYPGNSAAANSKADTPLPRVWRVEAVHADADSITYSVGSSTIL
jgi:hypothetical protein